MRDAVFEFINHRRGADIVSKVVDAAEVLKAPPPTIDWKSALVEKPTASTSAKNPAPKRPRLPRRIDYAARDEGNRTLGKAGEEWVRDWETKRLTNEGRPDLAAAIDCVAISQGDGTGFDVLSYSADGSKRLIEVKTTNGGLRTPFLISKNEVELSAEQPKEFFLYRVFDFGNAPKLYVLQGDLREALNLEPQEFRAFPK